MNRKGFTLIELVGTIVLISIMVLIIVPTVNRVIKLSQVTVDKQLDENLLLAARNWASDHKTELPKTVGWSYNIQLSKLKEEGYLDSELKKPSTGEDYGDRCVQITNISKKSKKVYKYSLEDTICKMPIVDFSMTLKAKTANNPDLASGTWTNQNVTLYAIDESGQSPSGNNYSYEWYLKGDSTAEKVTKNNERLIKVSGNQSGTYTYYVKMNNGTSVTQPSNEFVVKIDKKAPMVSIGFQQLHNVVKLSFSDTGSGLRAGQTIYYGFSTSRSDAPTNYYNIDAGNNAGDSSVTVTLSADRIKQFATGKYYLWVKEGFSDVAGNKSQNTNLGKFLIDNTKPVCNWSGENSSWRNTAVNVKITGTDPDSGIDPSFKEKTWTYNQNNSATQTANLSYTIKDLAGNEQICSKTANVYYDKIAPTCNWSGENSSWRNTAVNVKVTGTDANSQINNSYKEKTWTYNQNNSATQTASLSYTIKDNANNSTTCSKTANVYYDKIAPACNVSGGSNSWTNGNRVITASCSDSGGSNCATANFSATYSSNINTTTAGANGNNNGGSVRDGAGNVTNCAANQTVRIDKTPPSCGSYGVWGTHVKAGNCGATYYQYISDSGGSGIGSAEARHCYKYEGGGWADAGWGRVCHNEDISGIGWENASMYNSRTLLQHGLNSSWATIVYQYQIWDVAGNYTNCGKHVTDYYFDLDYC